jgi:hypothetical protein
LNDPSFVFADRDELEYALKSARRVEATRKKAGALLWEDGNSPNGEGRGADPEASSSSSAAAAAFDDGEDDDEDVSRSFENLLLKTTRTQTTAVDVDPCEEEEEEEENDGDEVKEGGIKSGSSKKSSSRGESAETRATSGSMTSSGWSGGPAVVDRKSSRDSSLSSNAAAASPAAAAAVVVAAAEVLNRPSSSTGGISNNERDDREDSAEEGTAGGGGSCSISRRLVEYFVMVSCVPAAAGGGADVATARQRRRLASSVRPPDPRCDANMNSRTRGRFEVRRVHLPPPPPRHDGEDGDGDGDDDDGAVASDALLEPRITARYPPADHPDRPLNPRLPQFCHPEGTDLIRPTPTYRMPRVHHFALTDSMGGRLYGTALTVYEEYHRHEEEKKKKKNDEGEGEGGGGEGKGSRGEKKKKKKRTTYYAPRVLTLLSTYPYLSAFRTYLTQLYRLATTTDVMTSPIERYVQNICSEVPAPPPGAFEVELRVHPSLGRAGEVRFWAPPADQPVPYVSLPFRVLFECLDVGNVLFAWYSLACEGKVLLVSSQLSLLTVCGEILTSLLFPMRWSHLYIPVLPRSLCPMLDAPMPYLCGISRENFPYAVEDISDETIVVDLDRNVVTLGPNAPDLPPLPNSRRKKLEGVLKVNVGDIFWEARNLRRADVLRAKGSGDESTLGTMLQNAHAVWEEKIRTCDDAFDLAHAPDSVTLDCDEDANNAGGGFEKQSRWDAVQEGFLRFYSSLLQDYRNFLPATEEEMGERSSWRGDGGGGGGGASSLRYRKEEFVADADKDYQPFLDALVQTQQFDDFVTRKMHNASDAADIKFFDQSIDAKRNRSKLTLKKKETNFLHAASAHRDLKRIKAVEPSCEGLLPLPDGRTRYMYETWPVTFDERLFGTPRPIPSIISDEFDRRTALRAMLRSKYGASVEGHQLGGRNKSPEVTAFVLFFATFTSVIGTELSAVEEKHAALPPDLNLGGLSLYPSGDSSPTRPPPLTNLDDDMEVARTIAKAQIDLAYRTLSLMRARKLPPEPLVYKLLIQTCGRCKMTHVASLMMEMIARDGLATDASICTALISAFSNDETYTSSLALFQMLSTDNMSSLSAENDFNDGQSDSAGKYSHLETSSSLSEHSADLGTDASSHEASSSGHTKNSRRLSRPPFNKNMFKSVRGKLQKEAVQTKRPSKRQVLKVPASVARQIEIGESLLESLYPGIDIDTENTCPKCAAVLAEDHICAGWVPCASNDYQTRCSSCGHRFVPKFSVSCKFEEFVGSQGRGTPLYCDHFSPWVLLREIHSIMTATGGGVDQILAEEFRSGTDISATLWWNMVLTFRRYNIPFVFLFQGSFHNNLILGES